MLARTNTNGDVGGVVEGVEFGLCSVKRKAVSRPLDKKEVKHFVLSGMGGCLEGYVVDEREKVVEFVFR